MTYQGDTSDERRRLRDASAAADDHASLVRQGREDDVPLELRKTMALESIALELNLIRKMMERRP